MIVLTFYSPRPTHPDPYPPLGAPTVIHALLDHARERPAQRALTWLDGGEVEGRACTFGELATTVLRIGAHVRRLGLAGSRILLQYADGFDFLQGLLGCFAGGAVAVPATTIDLARPERTMPRLMAILRDCEAAAVMVSPELRSVFGAASDGSVRFIDIAEAHDAVPERHLPSRDDLAFIQYTSGSTGQPKGVCVRHGQLEGTMRDMVWGFGIDTRSVMMTWLPHYHDMGLILGLLEGVFAGYPTYGMTPAAFIERPSRWLHAMSRVRATHTAAPNFAYELVTRKFDARRDGRLDLSSIRSALNAAEPVRWSTVERFLATFEPLGFRREALMPCFGMAEASVKITAPFWGRPPRVVYFDPVALRDGVAVPREGGVPIVALGQPAPNAALHIVDPETCERRAPGQVGELWFEGENVADGYWNRPEVNAETFGARAADGAGPYLRTGDLAFLYEDELYFAGRVKDLIIVRGQNHHPHDIEATVQDAHAAVRPGSVAAFAVDGPDTERLVVVAEVDASRGDAGTLERAVREAVALGHDLLVHAFVPIAARTLPKTSSGKIRRAETRRAMEMLVRRGARGSLTTGGFADGRFPSDYGAIKDFFESLKRLPAPDLIFCHERDDRHQDHRVVNEMVWSTFRDQLVLEYEIPKWDGGLGEPNMYVPVSAAQVRAKVQALMTAYRSQRHKDWFSADTFRALARLRGLECRARSGHAEAFHARKVLFPGLGPGAGSRQR